MRHFVLPGQSKWSEMHEMCSKYLCTSTQDNNSKPWINIYFNRVIFILATILAQKTKPSKLLLFSVMYWSKYLWTREKDGCSGTYNWAGSSNIPKMSSRWKLHLTHLFPSKLVIFVDILLEVVTEFWKLLKFIFKNFPVMFQKAWY